MFQAVNDKVFTYLFKCVPMHLNCWQLGVKGKRDFMTKYQMCFFHTFATWWRLDLLCGDLIQHHMLLAIVICFWLAVIS